MPLGRSAIFFSSASLLFLIFSSSWTWKKPYWKPNKIIKIEKQTKQISNICPMHFYMYKCISFIAALQVRLLSVIQERILHALKSATPLNKMIHYPTLDLFHFSFFFLNNNIWFLILCLIRSTSIKNCTSIFMYFGMKNN